MDSSSVDYPTPNFFDGLMKKQTYPGAKETYSSNLGEWTLCFIHKDEWKPSYHETGKLISTKESIKKNKPNN